MKLYFVPFACSLATRIAVAEAGLDAEFVEVPKDRQLPDGRPFTAISPMGYVPALETPAGLVLTEGPAVLQYIADLAPEGQLAPPAYSDDRYRLQQWLNFISTEVHKDLFHTLMGPGYAEGEKAAARARGARSLGLLAAHLDGRAFVLERFTIADAYLVAVLNWCEFAGVPIADWPALLQWRTAMRRRPSVAEAIAAERPLLQAA